MATAPSVHKRKHGLDSVESFYDYVFVDERQMDHDSVELMIGLWHDSDSDKDLHEYLGWTWEQYARYVESNELPW